MRLNGAPWSRNVLRVSLTNVPVAFPNAIGQGPQTWMRFDRSRLTFCRLLADQKALGSCDCLDLGTRLEENKQESDQAVEFFRETQTMFNINGLLLFGHQ